MVVHTGRIDCEGAWSFWDLTNCPSAAAGRGAGTMSLAELELWPENREAWEAYH